MITGKTAEEFIKRANRALSKRKINFHVQTNKMKNIIKKSKIND